MARTRTAGMYRRILHASDFSPAARPAFRKAVELAKSRRADVIVIGTHGRTGFQRALMGSVAARVIALARCAVLAVRA